MMDFFSIRIFGMSAVTIVIAILMFTLYMIKFRKTVYAIEFSCVLLLFTTSAYELLFAISKNLAYNTLSFSFEYILSYSFLLLFTSLIFVVFKRENNLATSKFIVSIIFELSLFFAITWIVGWNTYYLNLHPSIQERVISMFTKLVFYLIPILFINYRNVAKRWSKNSIAILMMQWIVVIFLMIPFNVLAPFYYIAFFPVIYLVRYSIECLIIRYRKGDKR